MVAGGVVLLAGTGPEQQGRDDDSIPVIAHVCPRCGPRPDNSARGDPETARKMHDETLPQEVANLRNDLLVVRGVLHRLGRPLDMHADDRSLLFRTDPDHVWIERQAGNVIDDRRTGPHCLTRDLRLGRID